MAKSKAGGTRTYLRGRVGADVYSIGKDGKGKKQQVVRSLAESVANPQTAAQMRQRMIMTSVSLMAKGLSSVIDHSFDGIPAGQPSISEFTRRAIASYVADAALTTKKFGYAPYQSKVSPNAAVVVANGKAKVCPWSGSNMDDYSNVYGNFGFSMAFPDIINSPTDADMKWFTMQKFYEKVFDGDIDGYLTFGQLMTTEKVGDNWDWSKAKWVIHRIKRNPAIDLTAYFNDIPAASKIFLLEDGTPVQEGYISIGAYANDGVPVYFYVTFFGNGFTCGSCADLLIVSKKVAGKWIHSKSAIQLKYQHDMSGWTGGSFNETYPIVPETFDNAFATYPEGSEKFLNGGEL